MTHEELLTRIDDQEFAYDNLGRALIAVVELHKPNGWYEDTKYDGFECVHCDNGSYPCPTIQAIEKELK